MGLFKEFRTFIIRGNAIDMAVGIIIGAAFGAVVGSLVKDVMMPPLGYVLGGIDFEDKMITLAPALQAGETHPVTGLELAKDMPAVVISYGKFINAMITLLIQGFAVFMVVKFINTLKRNEEAAPPPGPTKDQELLSEIRDLLKSRA